MLELERRWSARNSSRQTWSRCQSDARRSLAGTSTRSGSDPAVSRATSGHIGAAAVVRPEGAKGGTWSQGVPLAVTLGWDAALGLGLGWDEPAPPDPMGSAQEFPSPTGQVPETLGSFDTFQTYHTGVSCGEDEARAQGERR
eukprot:COSAG02_NODE_135_length_34565_cov_80.368856_12_plen_142_part_00